MKGAAKQLFGRATSLPYMSDLTLHYKLYEVHYDLMGAFAGDAYTMVWYGGVDGLRKRKGHRLLSFGSGPVGTPGHPSNRDGVYWTVNMVNNNGMVRILPHYDHYELLNTSLLGMYVSIPYMVHWGKNYVPGDAEDLMTVVATMVGTRNEQIQIAHDGASTVDMTWHGVSTNQDVHMQAYGSKVIGFDSVRDRQVYRVKNLHGMRWYLPPGKTCRFKVRVPGVSRCDQATLIRPSSFRYMDYGMVFSCKGDFTFTTGGSSNDAINMSKQYLGVRRTSTSVSVFERMMTGREATLVDAGRRNVPLPVAAQVKPEQTVSYVEHKEF